MRSTRAYLAGFGTAGSLLAAAAVLFVLASAVVSFQGWPEVSSGASSAQLVAPALRDATRSAPAAVPSRRVLLALAAAAPAGPGVGPGSATVTGAAGASRPVRLGRPTTGPSASLAPTPASQPVTSAPTPHPGGTLGGLTHPVTSALSRTVTTLGHGLSSTVKATGQGLGATVNAVGATLSPTVSKLSPHLGDAIRKVVTTVSEVVTNSTGSLAGLVANASGAVGTLLNGGQ